MVYIGKNIKRLRQERGIRQADLARALGVTCQAVSKWETSANSPDVALIPKIAELFGISINELFEEKSG
jgi:transcriptional regulator with XRE-family HTH domain